MSAATPGGEVDGDGRDASGLHGLHKAGNGVRQSWTAADAKDPVYDQVVRHSRIMIIELDQPATCRDQRRKAGRMWDAQAAECGDAYAPAGQPYAGEQRVASIVARSNHDHHVAPISAATLRLQQVGCIGGHGGRGPLHQCVHALDGDGPLFDPTDLVDPVGAHDHASQITTAEAMPAS